jgi:hypothetical protein
MAAITLKNNAGSNVTFDQFAIREDELSWNESGATSILGTTRAKIYRKLPTDLANGVYRGGGSLLLPQVTDGVLDGTFRMRFDFDRPGVISVANVDEGVARFKELVAQALVKAMCESGVIPSA